MAKRFVAFVFLLVLLFPQEQASSSIKPSEVLLVVNMKEPISIKVADYYRAKRGVPGKNVCRISCTTSETVTPGEYVTSILRPTEAYLKSNFSVNPSKPGIDPIKVILLTYGVPAMINQGERCSSVDSALTLAFSQTPWGRLPIARYCDPRSAIPNVYYGKMKDFAVVREDPKLSDLEESAPPYTIVRILDSTTAIAGGQVGLLARGERSGGTWKWTPIPDDKKGFIAYKVSDIFALDAKRIFVCTGDETGQGGSVIFSNDGGRNWRLIKTARSRGSGFVLPDAFYGVAFTDEKHGWAVGRWRTRDGSGPRIENTRDGGKSWTDMSSKFGITFIPRGISTTDANHVWICGNGGIYFTSDGGITWSKNSAADLYKIRVTRTGGKLNGWAVGVGGKILHSTDGVSWKDASLSSVTEDIKDLAAFGSGMAAAYGRGKFLIFDKGKWSVDDSDVTVPKTSVAISDKVNMIAAIGMPVIQYRSGSGWRNGEVLPKAHWRLRYLVCRLDGLSKPITNREGIPDDIKGMIDNAVCAKDGGTFLLEEPFRGDQVYGTENYAVAEKVLRRLGRDVKRDATKKVFKGEDDVIGYASFGMHDQDIKEQCAWGQPMNKWRPGAVAVIMESTDGRSLRSPHYAWGIGSGSVQVGAQVAITGLPYSGYWIAIHNSSGKILARAKALNGKASISVGKGKINWPDDKKTSLQVHFPEDDPLHPSETVESARYPGSVNAYDTRLYDFAAEGKGLEFKFYGVRNLAVDLIRSGASAVTANVDEPYMPLSGDANQIFPAYASGYTWAESAYMGFRAVAWKELAIGDPLMRVTNFKK